MPIFNCQFHPLMAVKAKIKNMCPTKKDANPKTKYSWNRRKISPKRQKNNPMINIKTVINGEEAISKISTCSKVEIFRKES